MMVSVVSIVGRKNSGKTTLIEGIVPELTKRGFRIGIIKHKIHEIRMEDIDRKGKDTYRYQTCGAEVVVLAGPNKLMLNKTISKPWLIDQIIRFYMDGLDLVLTEGYKSEDKPKIEVFRQEIGGEEGLLCSQEKDNLVAVVSDRRFNLALPCFGLNDYGLIADFLEKRFICYEQVSDIELLVDQKQVPLKGFAARFLKKTILGMISSLHHVPEKPGEIEIKIR